jgi:cytochrome c-type biogenesis protein CcmH
VLYKPPFKGKTSVLWIAPVIFLLMGLITVFFFIRRKKAAANLHSEAGALEKDVEKQKKIRSLLEKGDPS